MQELAIPNAVPVAPLTWVVAVDLPANVIETPSIPCGILQPFELLGLHAQVNRLWDDDTLQPPTVEQILVRMNSRADTRLTSDIRRTETLPVGLAHGFVPLPALVVDTRLLGLEFLDKVADLSFQFRWAVDLTLPAAIYDNARIFLSLLVRPLS